MSRKRIKRPRAKEPILEMEATQEGHSIFDYLSIWYGPPKIGKTTLISKFGGVYFLCTEPGYKFLKIRKSKIDCWEDFVAFVRKASKAKKFVKTVDMWCIDPIDKLAKFCMSYVCDKRGIDHPSDQEWGKGWEAFRDEFSEWILRLCAIGPGLAAISHVKERDIETRSITLSVETPAMPKTCYTILNDLADITVRIGYEPKIRRKGKKRLDQRRCLFLRGTETFEAGCRVGKVPKILPFETEEEVVEKIKVLFSERKEVRKESSKKHKKHKKRRKK